jgi:hypothetical protein
MSAQPQERRLSRVSEEDRPGVVVQQTLRREVNEQIRSINEGFGVGEPDTIDVICECIHANCTTYITMTVADYELVRRFPTHFFIKEGHDVAEGERVVSESADFIVVESSGSAGLYAVSADPRRRVAGDVEAEAETRRKDL